MPLNNTLVGHPRRTGGPAEKPLAMSPLPVLQSSRSGSGPLQPVGLDWGQAAGNLVDAKLAVQALRDLVDDAVFLDDEAYARAVEVSQYQHKIQAQQRRMREMELEMAAVQAEVVAKDQALAAAGGRHRELASQVSELQQELDNNSVVFKMHFHELLTRNEEIKRLNALVQSLQLQISNPSDISENLQGGPTQPPVEPPSSQPSASQPPMLTTQPRSSSEPGTQDADAHNPNESPAFKAWTEDDLI